MAAPAYCFTTLKIDLDEKPEEITIRCNGKITAESAYMFEREVRDNSIPISRGKGVAVINRIVLDLSNVTTLTTPDLKPCWASGRRAREKAATWRSSTSPLPRANSQSCAALISY